MQYVYMCMQYIYICIHIYMYTYVQAKQPTTRRCTKHVAGKPWQTEEQVYVIILYIYIHVLYNSTYTV